MLTQTIGVGRSMRRQSLTNERNSVGDSFCHSFPSKRKTTFINAQTLTDVNLDPPPRNVADGKPNKQDNDLD